MSAADVCRVVSIILLAAATYAVPYSMGLHARPTRAEWLLLGILLLLLGQIGRTLDAWGHPVVWYGAPLTALAAACLDIYAFTTIRATRRERSASD